MNGNQPYLPHEKCGAHFNIRCLGEKRSVIRLPAWVSIPGLLLHILGGAVFSVTIYLLPPVWSAVLVTLFAGSLHEWTQAYLGYSDFNDPARGGVLNGSLDILAFMVPALAVLAWLLF